MLISESLCMFESVISLASMPWLKSTYLERFTGLKCLEYSGLKYESALMISSGVADSG